METATKSDFAVQEQGKPEGCDIPLYASDGKTVVDRFFLAPEGDYGK